MLDTAAEEGVVLRSNLLLGTGRLCTTALPVGMTLSKRMQWYVLENPHPILISILRWVLDHLQYLRDDRLSHCSA